MSNSEEGWGTSIVNALSELATGERLISDHHSSKSDSSEDDDDDYWEDSRSDDDD